MRSPHDLLPVVEPMHDDSTRADFYLRVVKPLLPDILRIQSNGIPIDMEKVGKLEQVVTDVLADVDKRLAANPIIRRYLKEYDRKVTEEYRKDREAKLRTAAYYQKELNPNNMDHRTVIVNQVIKLDQSIAAEPQDKWTVNQVKKVPELLNHPVIADLLKKDLSIRVDPMVIAALRDFAQTKDTKYNEKFLNQMMHPPKELYQPFNPGSSKQKQELFEMLGIKSTEQSKETGLDSWGKQAVNDLKAVTKDPEILDILASFIDHSGAAIIRNNFIAAFDKFVMDDVLYGNFKLFNEK